MTKSLNTLTSDITSLKTLTGPFVEEHEDIKCQHRLKVEMHIHLVV